MIVSAETYDHVLDRGDTFAVEVADRPAQNLG
jgi:hypothetical protein